MNELRVVLITAPDQDTADNLARLLVAERLAACVNIVGGVSSHYVWEGALHRDSELLLLVKTRAERLPELASLVRKHHPAKVPEIVALPILEGDKPYLDWIAENTR